MEESHDRAKLWNSSNEEVHLSLMIDWMLNLILDFVTIMNNFKLKGLVNCGICILLCTQLIILFKLEINTFLH